MRLYISFKHLTHYIIYLPYFHQSYLAVTFIRFILVCGRRSWRVWEVLDQDSKCHHFLLWGLLLLVPSVAFALLAYFCAQHTGMAWNHGFQTSSTTDYRFWQIPPENNKA